MCGRSVTRSRIELPGPWYSATGQSPQGCSSTPTQSDFCSPASEVMRLSSPHKQPHRTAQEKTVIAHVSIGVCDINRNKPFYDAALEPLGYKCLRQARTLARWRVRARALRSESSPLSARFRPTKKSGLHFPLCGAKPRCGRCVSRRCLCRTELLRRRQKSTACRFLRSVSGISRQRHGSFRAVWDTNWISSRLSDWRSRRGIQRIGGLLVPVRFGSQRRDQRPYKPLISTYLAGEH